MNELERTMLRSEYLDYVIQLAGLDLLIIDDFGLMVNHVCIPAACKGIV